MHIVRIITAIFTALLALVTLILTTLGLINGHIGLSFTCLFVSVILCYFCYIDGKYFFMKNN